MNKITFSDFIKNRTRKTKRWFNLFVFCLMCFMGQTVFAQFPAPYCNVSGSYDVEEITKVEFGDDIVIENTNTSDVLLNYTSEVANVIAGEPYTITVKGNTAGDYNNEYLAFIDWNQYGVLDDFGEVYYIGSIFDSDGYDSQNASATITIPESALAGETRIRITKTYTDPDWEEFLNEDPCWISISEPSLGGFYDSYGQALDFTLNVESENINPDLDPEQEEGCEIDVNLTFPGNADQIKWKLIGGDGEVALQGGPYFGYDFSINEVFTANNPPYSLEISIDDSLDWYCDNQVNYSITVGGEQDISGTLTACEELVTETFLLITDLTACIPDCMAPTGLTANNITLDGFTLSWTSDGNVFEIEWEPQGIEPGSGEGTIISNVTSASYDFTDLDGTESYQFYVRRDCSETDDGVSAWAGPFNFSIPLVTPSPWHEGFEEDEWPDGWDVTAGIQWNVNDYVEPVLDGYNLNTLLFGDWLTGYSNEVVGFSTINVSPILSGDTFSFSYLIGEDLILGTIPEEGTGNIVVELSTDFGLTYTEIGTIENNGVAGWQEFSYGLDDYVGEYIKVKITANLLDAYLVYEIAFDEFDISGGTVNPCPEVTEVEIGAIVGDGATLLIESEGDLFDLKYGLSDFELDEGGTLISNVESPYELTGLEEGTEYDVYVRSNCGDDNQGNWFGPVSFTTLLPTLSQEITVEDIIKVYSDAPFVNGESDSGLALTYTVADESVAVFEDGQIVIVGAGATEITASQSGNAMYLPAEDVTFTLTVSKAPLTISVEDVTKAYDGEVYAAWTIVYDEFVYDDDAMDLSGELIYSGDGVTAITPGTYAIEIGGLTSNNYDISFVSGNLTITKAELTGITFEDALLIYDGTAKSIFISGTLPTGVTVTYTGNGQTEVGDYPVTATIDGGTNYENLELEAMMKIRGELTGISFEDAEFVYDGDEKSLAITGTLPTGVTVTYTGNNQTNAGIYEVTANIDGGSDYMDETLTATLTIAKAALTGIILSDEEFVYDGHAKSLLIMGTLPIGVTVAYAGNGQTEAGVYEVVTSIDGGNNYEGLELTAELTIVKADLSGILSLEDASFVYDGDAKSLAVSGDIPTGVTVSYTGNGQTTAGVYEVTASISGGVNYEDLELSATLTTGKAAISGVTLEDGTFGYDGTSKSLAISGTLPEGTSVSYVNNDQVELGEYEVTATISGGLNYHDLVLTATLTITEGTMPGISFSDGYFVYDGTEKSIYISGVLPEGSTVSYANNGQTEAGSYVVTATISGNGLYTDLVLNATLTIAKAPLDAISFEDGTFVYDGETKSLLVSGPLPSSVTVSYQNNGKVNAGTYTVIADIDGGVNYVSLHLTAVLTIEKAPQRIDFAELGTVVKEDVGDFQLEATASSGLPVTYSYTYAGLTAAAEVSESGWVTLHHSGVIQITVHQEGNQNYLAATPVTRELKIESREASLEEAWIGEAHFVNPDSELYYRMECNDKSKEVTVRVKATYGASVEPDSEIVIKTPRPGIYKEQLTVRSANGKVEKTYTVIVEKPFGFFEIVEQKFDNTLLVNNNPNTNGGYVFVAYQWYKNGELIGEGQVYSAGDLSTDLLDSGAVYHAVLTTDQGEELYVCPSAIVHKSTHGVQLYPSPVRIGDRVTLQANYPVEELYGSQVRIYNMKGLLVYSKFLEGRHTVMDLPVTLQSGVYIAVMELGGKQEVVKFVVE